MKRTPLLRSTPLRRSWFRSRREVRGAAIHRPLAARSPAARAADRELARARRLVMQRDVTCVMCERRGEEVHHRLPRGAGGALNDPSQHALSRLLFLCGHHHRWAESQRSLAEIIGVLVPRGVTPCSEAPVLYHGTWVLLGDDGSVTPSLPPDRWSR